MYNFVMCYSLLCILVNDIFVICQDDVQGINLYSYISIYCSEINVEILDYGFYYYIYKIYKL